MGYLKFDRRMMSNLDESLQREYIRTNRMGAYCCSSIVGCNTRKYHGVLVVPIPTLSPNNHVLLSSLDLTIVQHGVPFNIAVHEYEDGTFSPKGHKYIREYNVDIASSTTYRVGGVVLRREFFFCHYEHRVIIKFSLLEAHSETTLRLSPLLAFRDVKMLTHKNCHIDSRVHRVPQGIRMCLYEGYPDLYMQLSEQADFVPHHHWNERIAYFKERERGYEYTEDLYVPGYFELKIEKDKPIYFSASITESTPSKLAKLFDAEQDIRIPRLDFRSCLLNASQQFYYRPNPSDGYLLAGYPWFGVRARDLFIALPGCSIYSDAPERYYRIMDTAIPILDSYMVDLSDNTIVRHLSDPDVGLWAIWAIQQYATYYGIQDARARYGTLVGRIIDFYHRNIHPKVRIDESGLLYVHCSDNLPLTWMDSKTPDGLAIVNRTGYLVELNALWYNALRFYAELMPAYNTIELEELCERVEQSFRSTFVNQYGYLFDSVSYSGAKDWSVRPNMIFAVSLPFSPLPRTIQRSVVEIVTRELRTPKGLRSLSPKSLGYEARCIGTHADRERSYYNGAVWPWLLGPYLEAYIKLYGRGAISFAERILIGMEEEVKEHGVGTISELFDGNPPYRGRGAVSLAMNVAEILRSLALLEEAKSKYNNTNPIIRYE